MQIFSPVIVKLGTLVGFLEKGKRQKFRKASSYLCIRFRNVCIVNFITLCPLRLVFLQLQIFGFEEIEKRS